MNVTSFPRALRALSSAIVSSGTTISSGNSLLVLQGKPKCIPTDEECDKTSAARRSSSAMWSSAMPLSPMSSRISLSRPRNLTTALSETKEVVKGLSFNVTTRGLVSTWTGGCFTLNSATFVSHTINRSILSVKLSGKPVEERVKHSDKEKDVFRLVTSVGQRKKSEFQWGIEHQIFGFRAPMLYHWATATAVSEVYYEVYMTRVQQTA